MTPYYQDSMITLYCAEYASVLPILPRAAAVVTDPPYAETSLEWDVWPDRWPSAFISIAPQLWCFGSMRMFWDRRDDFSDWKLAQDLVWEKHNGSGIHADRFRRVHEFALHFYRGEWKALHRSPPTVKADDTGRGRILRSSKPQHFGSGESKAGYRYNGRRIMRSVIPVASCHGYAVNETQKPEGIVRPLLEYSVPVGGLVIDPFAGSGTTLVVARQMGVRAIGIEKRESQCREIVKRLAQGDLFI
jgi:site-specific DNA-methyltransferase (adenine-specific)